jgi:predicted DNA-binding transcriptional regulator AlpA
MSRPAHTRTEHGPLRRCLRRPEAAEYVGVSPRKFDQLVADGRMPKPARFDGVVVWDLRKIDLALDSLFEDDDATNPWD